ncbi:hypothetical protein KP509_37G004500 [Ceratopteris richardii]|nr:hypothetical protein KP509_37G004500 [Ceratopteris richardii]
MYGFYSASIKFPAQDYAAGIVLAFYTSNADKFPSAHDELDFEFLGNIKGRPWRMQTNIFGNGNGGREERFDFWFDPTADYHNYSILWNYFHTVFMVDGIPIREMIGNESMGEDYPSKPMAMYATVWDGSDWATDGGRFKVDYKYAPFVASFKSLKMQGCAANPLLQNLESESASPSSSAHCNSPYAEYYDALEADEFLALDSKQKAAMAWVRRTHMYYSYCDDKVRYPTPLPECTSTIDSIPKAVRRRRQRRRKPNYNSSKTSFQDASGH